MVLNWNKPERAYPIEDWKGFAADSAPPGVYTPNMSDADARKLNAKLVGHKSGHPQVEIRTSKFGSQLLVIVSINKNIKYKGYEDKCNVRISANGPVKFSFENWAELQEAVEEAKVKLKQVNEGK